jgi:DNA-binding MarR family transcriptional regulator
MVILGGNMKLSSEQFHNSYLAFAFIRGINLVIENDIRKSLKNYELSFPAFRILWILYFDSNHINMSDLSYLAQTNISNIFRQLTKLKDEGLVIIENGNDARTKEVCLTEAGRKLVEEFIEENTTNSNLQIVESIAKISKEDFSKFIEVFILLSDELLGRQYSDFLTKSSNAILNKSINTP